jgi:serine/threonine protein kinase
MMIGTPYYMSPEQAQAKEVDHRTDLWAIAIIAFEAVTGNGRFSAMAAPTAPDPGAATRPLALAESSAAREKLELTTGQRSAVSSTSSGRPREPSSVAMLSLLGLAALIVIGVTVFMLSGGVQALRERQTAEDVAVPATVPAAATLYERVRAIRSGELGTRRSLE